MVGSKGHAILTVKGIDKGCTVIAATVTVRLLLEKAGTEEIVVLVVLTLEIASTVVDLHVLILPFLV